MIKEEDKVGIRSRGLDDSSSGKDPRRLTWFEVSLCWLIQRCPVKVVHQDSLSQRELTTPVGIREGYAQFDGLSGS